MPLGASVTQAVRLRKEAIANGTYGSFDAAKGGEYFQFIHGIHRVPTGLPVRHKPDMLLEMRR